MSEQLEQQFAIWFIGIGATALTVVLMWVTYFVCTYVYKAKLLEREERRLMIERGMVPPPSAPAGWPGVRARELELKAEERRLMIEKGLHIPPESSQFPAETAETWSGLGAIGLGLAGAYVVFKTSGIDASDETRNWFLFFGVHQSGVTLYGIANVVYYQSDEDRRERGQRARSGPLTCSNTRGGGGKPLAFASAASCS